MSEAEKIVDIACAFEVWADLQFQVRSRAQLALSTGDLGHENLKRLGAEMLHAQHLEAYARGRLQSTIAAAADGVTTMADELDEHWGTFWGTSVAASMAEQWRDLFSAAHTAQVARREAARAMSDSLKAQGQ